MDKKVILWLIWITFVAYTLLLAPLDQPGTLTTIGKLLTFQLEGINPYVITLFSLMGVWSMVYACLMFIDEQMQDISAILVAIASETLDNARFFIPQPLIRFCAKTTL